ncbi:hypothetical protein [Nonomuraea roseola]|uniref:Uncharacterized protein n=1 Tax=Nonomuraea roseola TaxID=46179 RepID=A0ABV5Q4Z2_9ACTN
MFSYGLILVIALVWVALACLPVRNRQARTVLMGLILGLTLVAIGLFFVQFMGARSDRDMEGWGAMIQASLLTLGPGAVIALIRLVMTGASRN